MRIDRPALHRLSLAAAALVAAAVLSSCTATGGGWISSNDPGRRATLAFSFASSASSPETTTFSGTYRDPSGQVLDPVTGQLTVVDVALKGTGSLHECTRSDPTCPTGPREEGGCLVGEPTYQSQNPRMPGAGTLFVIVCDLESEDHPRSGHEDSVFVSVDTGPYVGYTDSGTVSGNVSVRS